MQFLSDGVRFVRLVVSVVSLFTLLLYYLFSYLWWYYLSPICATSHCGRSLVCFFPQSEMLNALLISSFNSTGFNNFQFYSTGFNTVQFYSTAFNNFQFYSTGFNNFQFYSTGFNTFQFYSTGFNTTLSFDLGLPFLCPFLRDPFTRSVPAIHAILLLPFPYTCVTFCAILFLFDKVV